MEEKARLKYEDDFGEEQKKKTPKSTLSNISAQRKLLLFWRRLCKVLR